MKRLVVALCAMLAMTASGLARPAGSAPQSSKGKSATPADLDKLLAPIALYPDALLAQMLMCASNPGKVGTLDEWLQSQQSLKGTALQDAAAKAGFEDSYVALAIFPDVVHYMAQQVDWTTRLGQAFAADKTAVFDSIQRLRKKAKDAGTLKTTEQQQVETKTTSGGQQVIVIEPSNPQVVYVPQYNPQVVYVEESSNSGNAAAAGAIVGFTAGIVIGAAIDNDYYYGPYGWHGGGYMYNDAWDDYYDHREDAREDWQDHREDIADERGDRSKNAQEQRTERTESRNENRPESQAQRTGTQSATPQARTSGTSQESRGYGGDTKTTRERSGTSSDAFSGYSSGKSERAASSRGKSSRSSSRSSGGSRRR